MGLKESTYSAETIQLEPGDRLIFYTDGITETRNSEGEEFGSARLIAAATRCRAFTADEMKQELFNQARSHGNGGFEDDATVVVMSIE